MKVGSNIIRKVQEGLLLDGDRECGGRVEWFCVVELFDVDSGVLSSLAARHWFDGS